MSINGLMDKENVLSKYNGILLILKRERSPAICENMMKLQDFMLSEINHSEKDQHFIISLI